MKYLMLLRGPADLQAAESDDYERGMAEGDDATEVWVKEMDGRGVRILGERLRPDAAAKGVRVRGGHVRVTDGPFTEAKEHIGGFDVLECRDLEEAVEVAAKHPFAQVGTIEVREAWPFE